MPIITAPEADRWNALVERAATGNVTQTWEWGELRHLGPMHRLAVADAAGDYAAALLLVEDRAPGLRRPYLYAPRGPVCDNPTGPALPELLAAARQLAQQRGAFMVKIEPNAPDGDADWLATLTHLGLRRNPHATHPRRSWVLDIRPDEAALLAAMKDKWRYNIRLAGRKGVQVRPATGAADRAVFYHIYQETAARDGFFIHPPAHYDAILDLFGARDAARLFLADYEGAPIAGLIAVRCGAVTTYMFGASSNQHRNVMPNHLLQWTAIRWAKEHGGALYDLRAVAEILEPDEDLYSLYTYKQGFGGYSTLSLETHDLVTQPPVYWAYRRLLEIKRDRDRRRAAQTAGARHGAPLVAQRPGPGEEGSLQTEPGG